MTRMNQTSPTAEDMDSPIRALHSLRTAQVMCIATRLKDVMAEWSFEPHESCDGQLSLLLDHPVRDLTIVVDRNSAGILVSVMVGDELQAASYPCGSVAEAVDAIQAAAGDAGVEAARQTA